MIPTTLVFLLDEQRILLGMKKRGFGKKRWNGIGGKIEEGETIKHAAVREVQEEICVKIEEEALEEVGVIDFYFEDKPEWNQRMHIFLARTWGGEPEETEEMRPQWFLFADIPYTQMWVDDEYWLPRVLDGEQIRANFTFIEEGKRISNMQFY